jgi:hypothetical protein
MRNCTLPVLNNQFTLYMKLELILLIIWSGFLRFKELMNFIHFLPITRFRIDSDNDEVTLMKPIEGNPHLVSFFPLQLESMNPFTTDTTTWCINCYPYQMLSCRSDGRISLHSILDGQILCETVLPDSHSLASWKPVICTANNGKILFVKGGCISVWYLLVLVVFSLVFQEI